MKRLKHLFRSKEIRFFILSVVLLQSGFYLNLWNVADKSWFYTFQQSSESLIIGRLAASEREGLSFKAGLLGRYCTEGDVFDQYPFYENKKQEAEKECFETYDSQIAGQAFVFVLLDQLSPFSKATNIRFFRFCSALLLTIILALFLSWVSRRYGLITAFITLLFCLSSHWLTVFGRNLYWVVGVLYVPFIFMLYRLDAESSKRKSELSFKKITLFSFLLVSLKCVFTGFELITTTLVMFVVPIVYFAYLDSWKRMKFFKRVLGVSLGVACAVLFYFIALAFQLSFVKGSLTKGFEHIAYSFSKRTSGGDGDFPEIIKESLESTVPGVLEKYWSGVAIDLNTFVDSSWRSFFSIDYGELILLFIIFSILVVFVKSTGKSVSDLKRKKALVIVTWLSILAPLSWHIIFKGHSYIHTHTNFIAWYMPFCLFGFAIIGNALSTSSEYVKKLYYASKRTYKVSFQLGILIILTLWAVQQYDGIVRYEALKSVQKESNLLASTSGFEIYQYDNKLWYFKSNASPTQMRTRFFLHVVPEKNESLPQVRRKYDYANLDFYYRDNLFSLPWWKVQKNDMIVSVALPEYQIKTIKTGQFLGKEIVWEADIKLP